MFFKCPIEDCQKLFNCKKALKEHERTHDNNRPFKCESCDQTFTQYSSLQKHARVHDKQKPYPCDHPGCTQAFSQVSNLIRHQRIHTGDKPFKCAYCTKKFASGSNLKQHLQIHQTTEGRSNFECIFDGCKKNYLYQSSLKKHYLVSHKEQYEELLASQKISTCGFQLNEKGEKIPFQKVGAKDLADKKEGDDSKKDSTTITIQIDTSKVVKMEEPKNVELQKKDEDLDEKQKEEMRIKEEEKRRMVEKGLMQSQQIKENPLTQNFAVGKRGRPPNVLKNPNPAKKAKRDGGNSELNSSEQKREAAFHQVDAIKEAYALLQKSRSTMSPDEFNSQNEFLSLISSLMEGLQGKSNLETSQIPPDLQKIIKASAGMSQSQEFQAQDINKLLQGLILNRQTQGNGMINQNTIQQLLQGLGQQFQNQPRGAFNNLQRLGYQPNGNQFAPSANPLGITQEQQLQYLTLVQNQQKTQQQLGQGPLGHQLNEKPQEINQAQALNLLPQMSPNQQLNIGGNININLSNINLNQFSINAENPPEVKAEPIQQQEPQQFKGSFREQKKFSLQNFISEPGKKPTFQPVYTDLKENILNTLQKNKNVADTKDLHQEQNAESTLKQQQNQQQTNQQKSKLRQMLADDEALSGQNSDEEDEVEKQVKEPLSALRGAEFSAVRAKEDGHANPEQAQRPTTNVKQESNSMTNSNGNHFYNCQFIISGAQRTQQNVAMAQNENQDQQQDDKQQSKDNSMNFPEVQANTDSKIADKQNQDKQLVNIAAIDDAKGQSSIGELVGAQSQNALNNDSINNIESIQNISKLQNSLSSFNQLKGHDQSNLKQQEKLSALQQLFQNKQSMNSFEKPGELNNLRNLMPIDRLQSLDPATFQDQLKMSSNSLIQDRMRQASRVFGKFDDSQMNFLDPYDNLPKAERRLSFLLDNNLKSSRKNFFPSNANLNNPQGNNGVRSKFSSHVNLLPNGAKGLTMAQSNIFDQFQNTKIPSKPPSICSRSNNGRSNPNLLKYSQSLTDVNPLQAQDLLRRIQKQNPEQLRQLIQQTQQHGLKREQSNRSFSNLSPSKLHLASSSAQIPGLLGGNKSSKPSASITPQSATTSNNYQKRSQVPTFLDACKAAEQQQNKSNKKFMQNLNKISKEGKMSGLFNRLHKVQNQAQENCLKDNNQSSEVSPLPIVDTQENQNISGKQPNLNADKQMSPPSSGNGPQGPPQGNMPDKSGDEFEDDEDQEVDGLFLNELNISPEDRRNSGIPSALIGPKISVQDVADTNIQEKAQILHQNLTATKIGESSLMPGSCPLDAMNVQVLMDNPALTQHLINVLTENLQKSEAMLNKQTQATPVFSYQEMMKKQIMNDRSQTKQAFEANKLMPNLQNYPQLSQVNSDKALNQIIRSLGQNQQNIQAQLLTNFNYDQKQNINAMQAQQLAQQPSQEKSQNDQFSSNAMMLPVSTVNKKKQQNSQKK